MSIFDRPARAAGGLAAIGTMVAAACVTLALSLPAQAQDATGIELWNSGGCSGCHGELAGGGGDPANPGAPSLRRRLAHDLLVQTISCGRPDAGMPAFLKGAYMETACNDMPVGTVPTSIIAMDAFTAAEIDTLVAWLEENVVAKQKITRENCALFFDGNANAPTCLQF